MICRNNNKNGNNSCISFWIILVLVVIFGAFVFNFKSQQLSSDVSDWGAFGSYVGGTMGFISVFLVYMTFNNQVRMNRRSQFEAILYNMMNNLDKMCRESKEDWGKVYDRIDKYFQAAGLSDTKLLNTANVYGAILQCYGSCTSGTGVAKYMDVFSHVIEYMNDEDSIEDYRKTEYYAFVSSQMSNETMIVVMIHFIATKNQSINRILDEVGFFKDVQLDNKVLERIRLLYFPKTKPKYETSGVSDGAFIDQEEESDSFMDYYSKHIVQSES